MTQKAKEQHSTLNEVARDIIAEYITKNPVLGNDAVQALFQYNYQLLRIGRNINQIARQFNEMSPQSLTTKQLNELVEYLDYHTDIVHKVLEKQEKPLKFSESWRLMYAAAKQAN
ncbi:plasmid mobilization relaxosome protein MobC [Kingella kingae]|uniref:plasmid mobilization relaxosome protein MobC n=1 Tax=Kingella kingae TaxID=504 RepID=UPI00254E7EA2|nr:plasmid mobilization relaxosome protein MobC [Kingella kingae]MDK4536502.1 plasmid mobilization relaxosome protein MobC [Kingella kingae]MDK4537889.1 plasmid mobilization relaxosome protein MobC [Kingella kingae]MDK4546920.1 plasmid mobilization relaxosome protein MobC [Kingella kingae]MDK4622740.1 plasmid mobilization relaxosome protein MobC [Kingella kingae]